MNNEKFISRLWFEFNDVASVSLALAKVNENEYKKITFQFKFFLWYGLIETLFLILSNLSCRSLFVYNTTN